MMFSAVACAFATTITIDGTGELRFLSSNPNRPHPDNVFGNRVVREPCHRQCEDRTRSRAGRQRLDDDLPHQAMRTNMTMIHEEHRRRNHADVANDPRWARIIARDQTADGHLWYSVVTTGVYCRPSCPSRSANPKNVQLHDTIEEAMATGFRPCKRCNPDGLSVEAENVAIVARACRLIQERGEEASLTYLAAAVGCSPSYFHRRFKAITGLTAKDYSAANRASKVRERLASSNSVTDAIYDAGLHFQ